MSSDIFLKTDRIEAVPTNDQYFGVTTGEGKDADIRLSPNSAAIALGGGDGDYSDGDLRLFERPDGEDSQPRIHFTAGPGSTDSKTRIRGDGRDGSLALGGTSADRPDVELLPDTGLLRLGGGDGDPRFEYGSSGNLRLDDVDGNPRVFISTDYVSPPNRDENTVWLRSVGTHDDAGKLTLGKAEDDFQDATIDLDAWTSQLTLGSETGAGVILLYGPGLVESILLDADEGDVHVGGTDADDANGVSGTIRVDNEAGNRTAMLHGGTSDIGGGRLSLSHPTGAETSYIRGENALLHLGNGSAGADGVAGAARVSNTDGNQGAILRAEGGANGGLLRVSHKSGARTIDAAGGLGRLRLGNERAGADGVGGLVELENAAGNETGMLAADRGSTPGATLALGHESGDTTVNADGGHGSLTLGNENAGSDGIAGAADLVNAAGEATIALLSDQADAPGAELSVSDDAGTPTAVIDGSDGTMTLGSASENATLSLEDGEGMLVDLEADDGTVSLGHHDDSKGEVGLELEPEAGIFSVVDGDGDPVFQIDTQDETIKTAKGYKRGVIGHGP